MRYVLATGQSVCVNRVGEKRKSCGRSEDREDPADSSTRKEEGGLS